MGRGDATQLLEGALGYFWRQDGPEVVLREKAARPGYISKHGRGIGVRMLLEDPVAAMPSFMSSEAQLPFGFVGTCEKAGAVVLDVVGVGKRSIHLGGSRASTEGFIAQTVVMTNEALDAESLHLAEATIRFRSSELFDWAKQHAYESTVRTNEATKLIESATLELLPTTAEAAPLRGFGEVAVEADWQLGTRTESGVSVDLALELTVRASAPQESRELMKRLGALQVLISSVVGGFAVAEGGRARIAGLGSRGPLWNSVLMRDPTGSRVPPYERKKMPFVQLPTLGGVPALSRWIRLTEKHPRAVAPIVNRWRAGWATSELLLVECAVAIEYWVAAHRRSTTWARGENGFHPLIVAKRVAREFTELVGDRQVWADRFWRTYNDLKHNPRAVPDSTETYLLAETGYYLLLGLLLDRVAGTKAASRHLFQHHRLAQLGNATRETLGTK